MRRSAVVMVVLLALAGPARGEVPDKHTAMPSPPEPALVPLAPTAALPATEADLRYGDQAPDFQLDSSLGGVVRRADLKERWFVLVFDENRTKLAPLAAVEDSIRRRGVQLLAVCPDGVGALRTFAAREKIAFPLLSDPTREISQLFGMYDDDHQAIQSGLVIVDPEGIVRLVLQGPSLDEDDVLQMVKHVLQGA
jgi:thioredoxin-dependent peroxiredoxin